MKIRDVKGIVELIDEICPIDIGLKVANEWRSCSEKECLDCWYKSLNLKENQDKLDYEIDI